MKTKVRLVLLENESELAKQLGYVWELFMY